MGRFTFPATTARGLRHQAPGRQNTSPRDSATIVSDNEICGSDTSGDFCGESNNDGQCQLYTVYFDIIFNQPFTASQIDRPGYQHDRPAAVDV